MSTIDGLFYLAPHAYTFKRYPGKSVRLGQTRDGTFWVAERHNALRPFSGDKEPGHRPSKPAIELDANRLLIDRDNSMWVMTYQDGIARIGNPQRLTEARLPSTNSIIQHFTQEDGLSDNRITAALEDHEGNIWVATRGGLDRFRPRNVVPSLFPYGSGGEDLALVADHQGNIWAGNFDQPLMLFERNTVSFRGGARRTTCEYRDPDGTLWFGGESSLTRLAENRLENVPLPKEIDPRLQRSVQAITRDHGGGLWVSVELSGVFRSNNGVWTQWGNVPALPKRTAVTLWTDPAGGVWFGYTGSEVALLDGDTVQTFSPTQGLSIGTVTAIGRSHGHIWVGCQLGLAVFDGNRFKMVAAGDGGEFTGVSGMVEAANGDLWLNEASGVAHILSEEIETTLKEVHHPLGYELFDFEDGSLEAIAQPSVRRS